MLYQIEHLKQKVMLKNLIRRKFPIVGLILVAFLFIQSETVTNMEISITVSPSVLNIQNNGQVVTVHTDIAYGAVEATTVTLDGIEINSWKADNRGNFVAKFLIDEVKNLYPEVTAPVNAELILSGFTKTGISFFGVDEITVINNSGKN